MGGRGLDGRGRGWPGIWAALLNGGGERSQVARGGGTGLSRPEPRLRAGRLGGDSGQGSSLRFRVWCAEQLFPISPALSGEPRARGFCFSRSRPRAGMGSTGGALPWQHKDLGVALVTRAAFDLRHFMGLVALSSPCSATGALPKSAVRCRPQGRPVAPPPHPPVCEGSEGSFTRRHRGIPCPPEST